MGFFTSWLVSFSTCWQWKGYSYRAGSFLRARSTQLSIPLERWQRAGKFGWDAVPVPLPATLLSAIIKKTFPMSSSWLPWCFCNVPPGFPPSPCEDERHPRRAARRGASAEQPPRALCKARFWMTWVFWQVSFPRSICRVPICDIPCPALTIVCSLCSSHLSFFSFSVFFSFFKMQT